MLKKRLVISGILICIFLFFSIVGLSNDVKYDFRKTNWGMSKEEVKATECVFRSIRTAIPKASGH